MFLIASHNHRRLLAVSIVPLCLLMLAACGRRGPLEAPVDAAVPAPNAIIAAPADPATPPLQPDQRVVFDDQGRPIVQSINQTPAPAPKTDEDERTFVLDPLLD
jgi:predicted small lipoprotein YifL